VTYYTPNGTSLQWGTSHCELVVIETINSIPNSNSNFNPKINIGYDSCESYCHRVSGGTKSCLRGSEGMVNAESNFCTATSSTSTTVTTKPIIVQSTQSSKVELENTNPRQTSSTTNNGCYIKAPQLLCLCGTKSNYTGGHPNLILDFRAEDAPINSNTLSSERATGVDRVYMTSPNDWYDRVGGDYLDVAFGLVFSYFQKPRNLRMLRSCLNAGFPK